MNVSIAISTIGLPRTASNLARAANDLPNDTSRSLQRSALLLQRMLRARVSAPAGRHPFWGKSSPFGAALGGRSGKTRQRISVGPLLKLPSFLGSQMSVAVGSEDRHLAFHEKGGTITGSPYLRIPTAAAQTAAGVDINQGRSVRGVAGYRIIKSKAGNLWIVRELGGANTRRLEFMYLLKRSVRMRPRMIFAVSKMEVEPLANRDANLTVGEVTRRANG